MKKILVVEDDRSLLNGLSLSLKKEGYLVFGVSDIKSAKRVLLNEDINMAILDLNLPDGDGIIFCSEIRKKSIIPIIMLTARDLEIDEIKGIESGADDYITKPFSVLVLITRINSLFRRSENKILPNIIEIDKIILDHDQIKLFVESKEIEISPIEYKLIRLLMENKGQLLLKEQILQKVWDDRGIFVDENTLSVNIRRIRQKIEIDASNPKHIKTVRGMGYIWCI